METLEQAANEHADSYYDRESERPSSMPESILWENRKFNFIDGANWQKEQDKAIIVELLGTGNELMRFRNSIETIMEEALQYPDNLMTSLQKFNEAITKAENHLK